MQITKIANFRYYCGKIELMNISLTSELKSLIQSKVASGLYNNASEVVREALRLLHEQDRIKELKIKLLQKELSVGLESLDRGEFSVQSIDDIADDILRANQQ